MSRRWLNIEEILTLRDRLSQLLEDQRRQWIEAVPFPSVDGLESPEAYHLFVELPGMDKEELSLEVFENTLTLKGIRHPPCPDKIENFIHMERYRGAFRRQWQFPQPIDGNHIEATMEKDGILHIIILKEKA